MKARDQASRRRLPGGLRPGDYALFSDESCHTEGRFRSIAAVSLPATSVVELSKTLSSTINQTNSELKWSRVGRSGSQNVGRAIAGTDFVFSHLPLGLRVDVLTWDTEDTRHQVENRDDLANFDRMSYQLYRSVIRRRNQTARWHLRRDRMNSDGATIVDCLNSTGAWSNRYQIVLSELREQVSLRVASWQEVDSVEAPLVQVADLMAGMAAYSRTKATVMRTLIDENAGQGSLFSADDSGRSTPSARDRGRFRVVSHLYEQCKSRRLGVSFLPDGFLRTGNPNGPINFWHYEPQGSWDKAPVKMTDLSREAHR